MLNVTGHKRVEETLGASEKRYRLLFERSMAGALRTSVDGSILEVNDAFARILGFGSREELRDRRVQDLYYHPADREAMLERLLTERGLSNYELCLRHKDDSPVWVLANIVLHVEPSGLDEVQATIIDITERKRAEEALLLFRGLIDRSNDAIEVIDPETGRFLDVNETACLAHGYTRDEYLTLSVPDVAPSADPGAWARNLEQLRKLGSRLHVGWHRRKDGSIFPVEVNITYVRLNRDYIVAVVRDVTERRRAEDALRRSEERLRQAVRVSNLGIFDHDHLTETYYWSPEERAIHGWEAERPPTLSEFVAMLHPEDREWIAAAIRRAHDPAGDGMFDVEQRIIRPDGEVRWLVTRSQTVFEGEGDARHPVRTVGAVLDVTEWKRVEERLAEAQEIGGFGSFEVDVTTWVGHCSPALRRIFGFETDEPFQDVRAFLRRHVHPDDQMRADKARAKLLDEGGSDEIEVRYLRPDGQERILQIRRRALRTGAGQVTKIVGTIQDVTELKRLEEQFRQAQKMEAVGQLAGGVAHDFNNLLTVINGLSELAFHRMRRDDPSRELIAEVLKAGERAATLTRQLLAFSRKQVLQPQVLDVNFLLGELSKLLLRLIGEDIGLRLEAGPALGLVKVDAGQFEQAVINLAVNARDAMPRGGRLTIETRNAELDEGSVEQHPDARPGRYVLVAVGDTGHGMDAATRARIFEPFFTTKAPGRGTGLGLAMVYGFVKQSGGHIEVDSEVGSGTTFKVYLPHTDEAVPSGRSSQDLVMPTGNTETILLVEDQEAVRSFARHVLLAEGYTVLEARDGEEAFQVAQQRQGPIHLLVTDVVMPRMGGRPLADLLARDRPEIRVLFVSGYTDETITRYGVPEAGRAFLQKPFTPVRLAQKVREVLDSDTAGCR
jgi:two-component system, cell cycle sensor histidine kinase and response regulator CckA